MGRKALDESIAQKYAVKECVNKLATIGYNLPTYSSMSIEAIDNQGQYYDVDRYCLMKARNNWNDLVSPSRPALLYVHLLLSESWVLISFFLPTLNYRLKAIA